VPRHLQDFAINVGSDGMTVHVRMGQIKVGCGEHHWTILVDGFKDVPFQQVGGERSNVVDTEKTDKGVGVACTICHCSACLRQLNIVGHPQNSAYWIRVDRSQPHKVQDTLDAHEMNILLAARSDVAVDDWQENGCVAGSCRVVDLVAIQPVEG
jgi:hypothetical protein